MLCDYVEYYQIVYVYAVLRLRCADPVFCIIFLGVSSLAALYKMPVKSRVESN